MTDTNTANEPHVAPADVASPFFTFQQLWRTQMTAVLDESSAAFEHTAAELERATAEASHLGTAQMRAVHEAGRAWVAGVRTMLG